MILTKATAVKVGYTVPGQTPPSALSWATFNPTGTQLESGSVTVPTSQAVTTLTALVADEEYELTLTNAIPASWKVGQALRAIDSYGVSHDCLIFGLATSTKKVRVCDLCLVPGDTVTSVWMPEVSLPLTATSTPENGDGYRIALTGTTNSEGWADSLWYGVSPLNTRLDLTPREYFDFFPEATSDLATLSKRRDWGRLCLSAASMVEERLRGRDRWYTLVVPSNGYKRALASALHVLLAPATIPAGYSAQPQIWIEQANSRYNQAITDLLASGYYDANLSGTVDASEKNPGLGISYKVL